jgi:hypothetical protein
MEMLVSLLDLPSLCLDKVSRALIEDAGGQREVAAVTAARLSLTCKDLLVGMARTLHDEVVDPGCAQADDVAVAADRLQRTKAVAELLHVTQPMAHREPAGMTFKELAEAIAAVAPTTKIPKAATRAQLHVLLADAAALQRERHAAIREFLARHPQERKPHVCPVRPIARRIVAALLSGDSITRSIARTRYKLSTSELVALPFQRTRHGGGWTCALSAVLATVERRRQVACVDGIDVANDIIAWEKRWGERATCARRAQKVARLSLRRRLEAQTALQRLEPGAALDALLGTLQRVAPTVAVGIRLYLDHCGRTYTSPTDAVTVVHGCCARATALLASLRAPYPLEISGPYANWYRHDENSIWRRFVTGANVTNGAPDGAAQVANELHELRFLCERTTYCVGMTYYKQRLHMTDEQRHTQARREAMQAWTGSDTDMPQSLRDLVLAIELRGKLSAMAVGEWPTLNTRLSRRRFEALLDEAVAAEPAAELHLSCFLSSVAEIGAAVRRAEEWTIATVVNHFGPEPAERYLRRAHNGVAVALLQDDALLLSATNEQVAELAEMAVGLYRCPQCHAEEAHRFTVEDLDAHMREVHDGAF